MSSAPCYGLSREQALKLLRTGRFSDFTIKCEDKSFAVHKFMLATKSDFFNAVINSPFKEGQSDELTFQETDAISVAAVIVHLYTGETACVHVAEMMWSDKVAHTKPDHAVLLGIYQLADRLMLAPLKSVMAAAALRVARMRICESRCGHLREFHSSIYGVVSSIYSTLAPTDDLLRPSITKLLLKVEEECCPPAALEAVVRGVAPIVVQSDNESDSDNDSDSASEDDRDGNADVCSDSETGSDGDGDKEADKKDTDVAPKEASFNQTLKQLMALAEHEDGSAVMSGRLILHENRQIVEQLQEEHHRLMERAVTAEMANKTLNRQAKRQRRS